MPLVSHLLAALTFATSAPAVPPSGFAIEKIADGVYVAVRREVPGFYFQSNAVFIVGDSDVVVVDAQFTRAATRDVLAALRRITAKPVRYVINTHAHDDHITGNQVYRDAFPGVEFVGQANMREDMTTAGVKNREEFWKSIPGTIGFFRGLLTTNKSFNDAPITAEERTAFASDTMLMATYLADTAGLRIIPPTLTVADRMTLRRGKRTIDILYLGRGHSRGDLVVHLPNEGLVVAGDLVVWPVPTVGSTSFPADFATTLGKLRALQPKIIVPGHGPVMHDDSYVQNVERLLVSIGRQTAAAVARGDTLEQVRKSVNLAEFRQLFAGNSKLRGLLFDNYVSDPAIARAFELARR